MREDHAPEANPYLLTAKQRNHLGVVDEHIVISPFEKAAEYGHAKVTKHFGQSFGLSVFAGAFIALAFVFYLTVTTGSSADYWGLVGLVVVSLLA